MGAMVIENRNTLQKYLFGLRDLEVSSYKQRRYVAYLTNQYKQANNPRLERTENLDEYDNGWSVIVAIYALGLGALIGVGLGFAYEVVYDVYHLLFHAKDLPFGAGIMRGAIIGGVIGLLIGLAVCLKNYWKVNRKNRRINFRNNEAEQNNQVIISRSRKKAVLLKEELDRATKALKVTEDVRARFYALDIIYPKYRSLVPITMFCEYFDSGRCSELTGPSGAYNIYESESRLDRILVKLDDIIERLDQIRENQMMLAELLASCQQELRGLTQTVSKQAESLARLEDKAEVNNYYSRITACNTTCLTWLAVLERK